MRSIVRTMPPFLSSAGRAVTVLGSPNQPRADDGKWTDGPGGGGRPGGSDADGGGSSRGGASRGSSGDSAGTTDGGSSSDDSSDGASAERSDAQVAEEKAVRKEAAKAEKRVAKAEAKADKAEAKAAEAREKANKAAADRDEAEKKAKEAQALADKKKEEIDAAEQRVSEAEDELARRADDAEDESESDDDLLDDADGDAVDGPDIEAPDVSADDAGESAEDDGPPIEKLKQDVETAKAEHKAAVKSAKDAEREYRRLDDKADSAEESAVDMENDAVAARGDIEGVRATAKMESDHADLLAQGPDDYVASVSAKSEEAGAEFERARVRKERTKADSLKALDESDAAISAANEPGVEQDEERRAAALARAAEASRRADTAREEAARARKEYDAAEEAKNYWSYAAENAETIAGEGFEEDGDGDGRTGAAEERDDEELSALHVASLAVNPDELDAAYSAWRAAVDMSADELAAWGKDPCSRKASLDPAAVIERNLRLLRKAKASWDARDISDAKRTASFIARMLGMPRGEPVNKDCPYSKRDISLRNWARKGGTLRQEMSVAPLPPWLAPVGPRRNVMLADRGRSALGPAISGQLYVDKVVEQGIDAAPSALRETLSAVMGAIEGARSYAEVEQRLIDLAPDAPERSADFAALVEGAVMLGIGAGAWAVGEEADR